MLTKPNARDRRHACWLPLPIAISLLMGCSGVDAADLTLAARYQIEQPSQDMGDALRAISRVTGVSVIVDARVIAGRTARAVSGHLSGAEAIAAAIQGSGLESQRAPDGAVVVRPATSPAAVPAAAAGSTPASFRTNAVFPPETVQTSADDDVAIATADAAIGGDGRIETITRVEVTGSRLRRVDAEGPAPVNVYTARDIEKSGQPNLQRFLASLTEVSATAGEGAVSRTFGQGTVQLRGLPLGSTLVLVNGRKVQAVGSSTGAVFNLNLIPMAAIERIEVLPSGSSAVYGGDALAGVVNVILKKALDGQSLTLRLGAGKGFEDGSVSLATGGRFADGSYLVMGSYSRTSPLTMLDRAFFKDADYRRFGGGDERLNYCAPGSVRSTNGSNLPGLTASVAGIPAVAAGQPLRISDFQATAGTENLCNLYATGGGVALVHGVQTYALHSQVEHRLAGTWSAFGELMLTEDRMRAPGNGLPLTNVLVPAANPFNPFGADVRVTAVLGAENGTQGYARQSRFTRALVGVKGELAGDWEAEMTVSTSRDHGSARSKMDNRNATALDAALASTNPASGINLFTAGRAANDDVLHGIWSDTVRRDRGRKDQVSGIVRGSVGQLWAGSVDAIVGAEAVRDWYDMSIPVQSSEAHGTRTSSAVYGEARVPLLRGGDGGRNSWDMAAVTLAGRRDRYSDFGAASTFQGGIEVRPSRGLLIRGSAAGSFKPPTLLQTHVVDVTRSAVTSRLTDPARNNEPITSGTVVRTTNTELRPERGQSRNIGAVWEPEGGLGTRFSATYWQLRIHGMITVLTSQAALNYESLFPYLVTRGPSVNGQPGPVLSVKNTEVNIGRVDTAGTDADFAYVWKSALGRVTAGAGATRVNKYRVVVTAGAPEVDRLGRRFTDYWAPQWKGRLSLGVDEGAWSLGLTSRYLGSYLDAGTSTRRLGDFWQHDLAGSLNLKKLLPNVLPGFKVATFSLSVANATAREPQFVPGSPNFDVTQGDWRGRYAAARLSLDW
ncbi:TonB-dependent receptor plug domain-containing protein [Roseateles sp. DC23W]|uniref:TonB-dependent receptor plug domain-containing protein n=1 Tax=Pelomonas dachongensis TaxID=3299029 RepID=A0ABW7EUR2_9BURK